jgi:hypothetical protein
MWIVGNVHGAILDSFVGFSILIHVVKHTVFPASPYTKVFTARGFVRLELVSVMCVFEVKGEMFMSMYVNDDWSVIDDVMIKINKIFEFVAELSDSFKKFFLFSIMIDFGFVIDMHYGLNLKRCAAFISLGVSIIKLLSLLAGYSMVFVFSVFKVLEAKVAKEFLDEVNGIFIYITLAYVNVTFAFFHFSFI